MGKIKTSPAHNKKKTSKFQKLWQRAEKLKQELEQRDQRLDELAKRIEREIYPAERASALVQKPLLLNLLELGQRKSWTNWQRQELERWIGEQIGLQAHFSLIDDTLENAIARYDAFRLGVELDEDDGAPLGEQLRRAVQAAEDAEREQHQEHLDDMANDRDAMIDALLDNTLGKRPGRDENTPTADLFEQHPGDVESEAQAAYDQERAEMRKALEAQFQQSIDELMGNFLDEDELDGDEEFSWGFPGAEQKADSAAPKLDNATLQRMFRSAAAVLHPDREPDTEKRLEKQALMAKLLLARKAGDMMTVLSLYQEHVGDGAALSKADEKQLVASLEQQLRQLNRQLEEYQAPSEMHGIAWEFYHPAKSKVDAEIKAHLELLALQKEQTKINAPLMTSMRALKPVLEIRYERWREQQMGYYY